MELQLGLGTFQRIVLAVSAHAAKEDVTPVIQAVKIEAFQDGSASFVATDRYTIGWYKIENVQHDVQVDAMFLASAKDLLSVVKGVTKARGAEMVTITTEEDSDTYTIGLSSGTVFTFDKTTGNYPPVEKLFRPFEDLKEQVLNPTVALSLSNNNLAKLNAYGKKYDSVWEFNFHDEKDKDNMWTTRRGAILVREVREKSNDVAPESFEVLMQPNLNLR